MATYEFSHDVRARVRRLSDGQAGEVTNLTVTPDRRLLHYFLPNGAASGEWLPGTELEAMDASVG